MKKQFRTKSKSLTPNASIEENDTAGSEDEHDESDEEGEEINESSEEEWPSLVFLTAREKNCVSGSHVQFKPKAVHKDFNDDWVNCHAMIKTVSHDTIGRFGHSLTVELQETGDIVECLECFFR